VRGQVLRHGTSRVLTTPASIPEDRHAADNDARCEGVTDRQQLHSCRR
jgi:hypothetical protein